MQLGCPSRPDWGACRARKRRYCPIIPMGALVLVVSASMQSAWLSPSRAQACSGDCNGDGYVDVSEVVIAVNVALGKATMESCSTVDSDSSGSVGVEELVASVRHALDGCGSPTSPTQTPTPISGSTATATRVPTTTVTPTTAPTVGANVIEGLCRVPAPRSAPRWHRSGTLYCAPGKPVRIYRCDDRSICVQDVSGRTLLEETEVTGEGEFSFLLDPSEDSSILLVEIDVEPDVTYRSLYAPAAALAGATSRNLRLERGFEQASIVVDPASEGAARALHEAGLDEVETADLASLATQVRGHGFLLGETVDNAVVVSEGIAYEIYFFAPSALAFSPDGRHVYAASKLDDGLAVFAGTAGGLTLVEVHQDNTGNTRGIAGATAVAVSPDGRHVYVAGSLDDAVAVFGRDQDSGAIEFLEEYRDGVDGIDGLDGAYDLTVSEDGAQVYVVAADDDAVVVFDRDEQSGLLTVRQVERTGIEQPPFCQPTPCEWAKLELSSNQAQLYVLHGAHLAVYDRDPVTGLLSLAEVEKDGDGGTDPFVIAGSQDFSLSPDGRHLYVFSSLIFPQWSLFERNTADGTLNFAYRESTELGGATAGVVSRDGRHLYMGTDLAGLTAWSRDSESGVLSLLAQQPETLDGGFVEHVTMSLDDGMVYATSRDALLSYARDPVSGELELVEVARAVLRRPLGLDRPQYIVVPPDGANVYVSSSRDSAVAMFARDSSTGELTYVGALQDSVDGVQALEAASAMAISPDGQNVYVGARGEGRYLEGLEGALSVFRREPSTGVLLLQQELRHGVDGVSLGGPGDIVVSADGAHVYVSGAATVFNRDLSTGILSIGASLENAISDRRFVLSPDDTHLYVPYQGRALRIFSRDPVSGSLTFIGQSPKGTDPIISLAISADGGHVYEGGYFSDPRVVGFRRNPEKGTLGLLGGTAFARISPNSMHSSPDGRQLYVNSRAFSDADDAVAVLSRNIETGELTFLQKARNGQDGINGIAGTGMSVVSPDGHHLYVLGQSDNSVAVFDRDQNDGTLTFSTLVR